MPAALVRSMGGGSNRSEGQHVRGEGNHVDWLRTGPVLLGQVFLQLGLVFVIFTPSMPSHVNNMFLLCLLLLILCFSAA
jgi:hypothetical protein